MNKLLVVMIVAVLLVSSCATSKSPGTRGRGILAFFGLAPSADAVSAASVTDESSDGGAGPDATSGASVPEGGGSTGPDVTSGATTTPGSGSGGPEVTSGASTTGTPGSVGGGGDDDDDDDDDHGDDDDD